MYTFLVPLYIAPGDTRKLNYFKQTVASMMNQTYPNWSLIIIDDCSCNETLNEYINEVKSKASQTIIVHHNAHNLGPGESRNIGIKIASELGSKVIMFQDADDISAANRIEVTRRIFETTSADLVYSPFKVIDENNEFVALDNISHSIRDILKAMAHKAPMGKDVWKIIGTDTGYVNLVTSTSVRIEVALETPFPDRRASEDAYTWMVYSAKGAYFYYTDEILNLYRIPQDVNGSMSRTAVGKENFYKELARTNEEAFLICLDYAQQHNQLALKERNDLLQGFYKRLAQTLYGEGMQALGDLYHYKSI